MGKTLPTSDGCKGSFATTSRTKHLRFISSYPAATLSLGFFLVTCFVLFKDVADGAEITTDHVLSFAVLVGTFASGHLLSEQLRHWHLLPAVGLLVLFCAGTFYCVTASGGRNAATSGAKAELVHKDNDDRARVETDLEAAKDRLTEAQDKEADECASGKGPKCEGRKATREERQTYVNVLEAQLRLMDPQRSEYPELRHAAKLFASTVSASEQTIFDRLVLWFPFVKALFAEIATLVFGAIGFRAAKQLPNLETVLPSRLETVPQLRKPSPRKQLPPPVLGFLPSRGQRGKPFTRDEALNDLLGFISSNGFVPSQETLKVRFGVASKGTVSKWLSHWEAEGRIRRTQDGRSKVVTMPPILQ